MYLTLVGPCIIIQFK